MLLAFFRTLQPTLSCHNVALALLAQSFATRDRYFLIFSTIATLTKISLVEN